MRTCTICRSAIAQGVLVAAAFAALTASFDETSVANEPQANKVRIMRVGDSTVTGRGGGLPSPENPVPAKQAATAASAGDWPTFRHDNFRSGRTNERIEAAQLKLHWVRMVGAPQPAWGGPAKRNAFHCVVGLKNRRNYDVSYPVTVAGDLVYYAASADDSVHCLEAASGRERWCFTTDGPVRVAPTVDRGNVYFGSDDGYVYCLRAADGALVWRFRPSSPERRILNDGHLISVHPCRTGVMISSDTAYFAAGLLPWRENFLCAVDPRTGRPEGEGRFVKKITDFTPEAALAATEKKLYVPQGCLPPRSLDRASGLGMSSLPAGTAEAGGGGSFLLLLPDEDRVLNGPGNLTGWITETGATYHHRGFGYMHANAAVVGADRTRYFVTDSSVMAYDRTAKRLRWQTFAAYPHEVILAADTLFAGGTEAVAALAAATGKTLWQHPVVGRAFGLAVAGGALYVSTDEGLIYCFRADAAGVRDPYWKEPPLPAPLPPIADADRADLLGRWVFQEDGNDRATIRDRAGGADGRIHGPVQFESAGRSRALVLDGRTTRVELAADSAKPRLPVRAFTAEAWARIDGAPRRRGLLAVLLDNPPHDQRGWMLGVNGMRFEFTLRAKDGAAGLTRLEAPDDAHPGRWYHVAAAYDGSTMHLYVDGQRVAVSNTQRGDIAYPERTPCEIGVYREQGRFYPFQGRLHEVRLYGRALASGEILGHFQAKRPHLPGADASFLAAEPTVEWPAPATAIVRWETVQPSPTRLMWRRDAEPRTLEDPAPSTMHTATLDGLRRDTVYWYMPEARVGDAWVSGPEYVCDTSFNGVPAAVPALARTDRWAEVAERMLAAGAALRGIALVAGFDGAGPACALAARSRLRVVVVDTDADRVAAVRRELLRKGCYGRITVHLVDSFAALPFAGGLANLVVSDREELQKEAQRLLAPGSGMAFLTGAASATAPGKMAGAEKRDWGAAGTWVCVSRLPQPGAGAWTHQYGLADNAAYAGETLGGTAAIGDLSVRWIGRPGPRFQTDRQNRKPAPLAIGGRLFAQGEGRILALDACNGTALWSVEIPGLARFNIPHDCGNWCADASHLFAAVGASCWRFRAADGAVDARWPVAAPGRGAEPWHWGFVARPDEKHLVGSTVRAGASWTLMMGGENWYDQDSGARAAPVASDAVFVLDASSGVRRWLYSKGVVFNPTITVAANRVFFVECRNPAAIAGTSRRMTAPAAWEDRHVVALDLESGREVWSRPLKIVPGTAAFYAACAGGKLVVVSSSNSRYEVVCLDAAAGTEVWRTDFPWWGGGHGGHLSHPAIVGDRLFVRTTVLDLSTGKRTGIEMPKGGCGTYALTDRAVLYRPAGGSIALWDFTNNRTSSVARIRPDCWLSTIPALGMLLAPEGGGGCTCGTFLETSIALGPREP